MQKDEYNETVEQARNADLLEYFQISGYTIDDSYRPNYYIKDIPGLCINPDKNAWVYFYTSKDGGSLKGAKTQKGSPLGRINNSLDCLTLVLEMDFKEAVYALTGKDIAGRGKEKNSDYTPPRQAKINTEKIAKEKKELKMPQQAESSNRLYAYLCKTRKIPTRIVNEFVKAGILYQSQDTVRAIVNDIPTTFKTVNAVFIHKNKNGEIIGGEVQGLNSFKRFKGVAPGTGDSVFSFTPKPAKDGKVRRAYIFESAIDLMSFYTFCKKSKLEGAALISMAGLKPHIPLMLREQGVEIISCVDNDEKGRKFEFQNNFERIDDVKRMLDYKGFKDWNELLVFQSQNPNANLFDTRTNEEKNISQQLEHLRKNTNFETTEIKFLIGKIIPGIAEIILSKESEAAITDMGRILFEKGFIKQNTPRSIVFANGINETELYNMAHRMQNGEDIRRQLTQALLKNQNSFRTKYNDDIKFECGENFLIARYRNAERQVSYQEFGDAYLDLVKHKYGILKFQQALDFDSRFNQAKNQNGGSRR